MDDKEKQILKDKIEVTIIKFKNELELLVDSTQPISPENSIGRISRMDAINNKGVAEASLRSVKKKLSKLQMALTKINSPGFGDCARCKQPIPSARLMFMPESTRCVNCADKL